MIIEEKNNNNVLVAVTTTVTISGRDDMVCPGAPSAWSGRKWNLEQDAIRTGRVEI
jgi:hypothetical protein